MFRVPKHIFGSYIKSFANLFVQFNSTLLTTIKVEALLIFKNNYSNIIKNILHNQISNIHIYLTLKNHQYIN